MAIKKIIKKATALLTGLAVSISAMGVMPVAAAGQEIYTCVLYATDENESISIEATGINMNGDIVTNGVVQTSSDLSGINGKVYENQNNEMMDFHGKIQSMYFNGEINKIDQDYVPQDFNENISKATSIEGNFTTNGENVAINSAALMTTGDITINGGSFTSSGAVIYSQDGDITIKASNLSSNGLIYAPNGTVYIECGGSNIGGSIVAQSIKIVGGGNFNKNESFMQNFGEGMKADENAEPKDLPQNNGQSQNSSGQNNDQQNQNNAQQTHYPNNQNPENGQQNQNNNQQSQNGGQQDQNNNNQNNQQPQNTDNQAGAANQSADNQTQAVVSGQVVNHSFERIENGIDVLILIYKILKGEKYVIYFNYDLAE